MFFGFKYMLSRMCASSFVAFSNRNPKMPSGTFSASRACSVTIQAYPERVIFNAVASANITLASCLLQYEKLKIVGIDM